MNYLNLLQLFYFTAIFSMENEQPQPNMTILTCKNKIPNLERLQNRFNNFLEIYNKTITNASIGKYNTTFFGTADSSSNTESFYSYYSSQKKDPNSNSKQNSLLKKIKTLIKNKESFLKIIKNTQIVYPSSYDFEEVKEMYKLKVPIYIGGQANLPRKDEFYQLIWNEEMKNKGYDIYEKSTIPAFPSGLFPWYYYNTKEKTLEEKAENELLGIIFAHGVNFESGKTPDYKNFLGKGEIPEKKRINELRKYIQKIADTIIYSALILTQKANKKICYLRIPKMGLGQFLNKFTQNKSIMIEFYLSAFKNSLIRYHTEFPEITIYVDFFNYGNDNNYNEVYNNFFTEEFIKQHKEKIIPRCDTKGNIFDKNLQNETLNKINQNQIQTIIVHAGDAHAFLGNGGYYDASLERALLGFNNNDYLSPAHILNIMLGDFFKPEEMRVQAEQEEKVRSQREQKKEETSIQIARIQEESKIKAEQEKEEAPKHKIRSLITIITIVGLLGIIIFYYKTYLYKNIFLPIKNYLTLSLDS